MKSVISALLIFIFIIIISSASGIYVNRVTDEMLQSLYRNEKFVSKNSWDKAENETEKLYSIWKKSRNKMSMTFNHTITDNIDISIAKIKNAVQMRKKYDYFYERSNFELLLLNLKEQQKISAENIF